MNFPGGSICSSNRHEFSRRAYRKDMFFQGGSICSSNRPYYLIEQILIFPETFIWSSITYEFSRSLYFLIEQILIFQEALSSPRTHTNFQETLMPRTHRHFPGPSRTDILLIGLGGCFRTLLVPDIHHGLALFPRNSD